VAIITLPALLGLILSVVTGNSAWIVLIGVLLLLGTALDSAVYSWFIRYQPPWLTGMFAVAEFGLILVLADMLHLGLGLWQAIAFYWVAWALAISTKIALLPIVSLPYLESAGEFRRLEWSVPPSQAAYPVLAATPGGPAPGSIVARASSVEAPVLEEQPSPSGVMTAVVAPPPESISALPEPAAAPSAPAAAPPEPAQLASPPAGSFEPPESQSPMRPLGHRSAATMSGVTIGCYLVIAADAIALILLFGLR
jgi:hypothetical protein